MIKCATLLSALALAGCASTTKLVDPPNLPALSAAIAQECPGLPPLTSNTLAALANADAATAKLYADCKAKHAAVVKAYNAARAKRASYNAKSKKSKN